MNNRVLPTQCVQVLAALDLGFLQEYAEEVRDAAEFPHAVMMCFAGHLARRFADPGAQDQLNHGQYDLFVAALVAKLEHYLFEGDREVLDLISDSFIEHIYDLNLWLFEYLMSQGGPLLREEMLAHKKSREQEIH